LPRQLTELTKKGLTISWCKDIKSYKKLIPMLKEYPEYAIVTADDDIYYPKDWLEKLYMEYIKQPNMVHCHRAHGITFRYGSILPYLQWNFCLEGAKTKPSFRNFPTGVVGILYPPHVFYGDILREDLFLKLLTSTDDIWFWAMCVLNNIKINVVKNNIRCIKNIPNSQETSLWSINKNNINDENLQKIFRLYPNLYKKIRKYTIPYKEYAQLFFCVYNENTHKIFKILGFKIKLRKERLLKFRKNITTFLENIICIKNDGICKVIGIFRIKVKIKRKHKELLAKLKEQEKNIKNLKDEIKNIVLSQSQDLKKELIGIKECSDKVFNAFIRTYPKSTLTTIVVSLVEHCNLGCWGCDHFAPLAEKSFLSIDIFKRDMKRLSQLSYGNVGTIKLMGGEPLLHPQKEIFFKICRSYFPNSRIELVTNAILLSKQGSNFWISCHSNCITIVVTKYPLSIDWKVLSQKMADEGVAFNFYNREELKIKTSNHSSHFFMAI
jgi:hypothetical protein